MGQNLGQRIGGKLASNGSGAGLQCGKFGGAGEDYSARPPVSQWTDVGRSTLPRLVSQIGSQADRVINGISCDTTQWELEVVQSFLPKSCTCESGGFVTRRGDYADWPYGLPGVVGIGADLFSSLAGATCAAFVIAGHSGSQDAKIWMRVSGFHRCLTRVYS